MTLFAYEVPEFVTFMAGFACSIFFVAALWLVTKLDLIADWVKFILKGPPGEKS